MFAIATQRDRISVSVLIAITHAMRKISNLLQNRKKRLNLSLRLKKRRKSHLQQFVPVRNTSTVTLSTMKPLSFTMEQTALMNFQTVLVRAKKK